MFFDLPCRGSWIIINGFLPTFGLMMEAKKVIEWRRELHRRAELSFEEYRTQELICSVLTQHGIAHQKVAGTGVLATVGDGSEVVVLRADMDALPIVEASGVAFESQTHGVMHACGHDMHAAMLLGALVGLAANPPEGRTVLGLFQPGEEMHPGGASVVLSEGVFDPYQGRIRAFVGQHCSPEMVVGTMGICSGEFMASTDEILFTVRGQGGHAALPHLLKDPVIAAAALLLELKKIAPPVGVTHVLGFGRVVADGATNVIPDTVDIQGTFRTFSEPWRAACKAEIRAVAERVGAEYGVEISPTILDGYPSVYNNEALAERGERLIKQTFGHSAFVPLAQRTTAEDFGFYTRRYPSLFLRLGVGSDTRLHTGAFCPDEGALAVGVEVLDALARSL